MAAKTTRRSLFLKFRVSVYRPKNARAYIIRYDCPDTGRHWKRTRLTIKGEAEDAAEELLRRIEAGHHDLTWDEFERMYFVQHIEHTSRKNRLMWDQTDRWIRDYFRPRPVLLADVCDSKRIARWQDRLHRERSLSPTSIGRYSAYLRAALRWAYEHELIDRVPRIAVKATRAREGLVTLDDLEALCRAAMTVRPKYGVLLARFLRGLFWSGLRLDQLRQLSWDRGSRLWLDGSGQIPRIWITSSGEKSRREECRWILPEFWELCCDAVVRHGIVFRLPGRAGRPMSTEHIGHLITKCGRQAGIIADAETGKMLSAHDMRRGCAVILHERYHLTTDEVQVFLGHADIKTTQHHYPPVRALKVASRAWDLPGGAPGGAANSSEGEAPEGNS